MIAPAIALLTMMSVIFTMTGCSFGSDPSGKIDRVISKMSMDEKISQMIIPAIRTWNEEAVTDLQAVPELQDALRRHQYGGVILYGGNITGNEQITRLIYELQENNKKTEAVSSHIPYLTPVDEEGGIVLRLTSGTRMTGNMAIGATDDAESNAEKTGEIIGEELAAAGFNTDFAPVIDVNNNPGNPVIGTRSFSDDPEVVSALGNAYAKGLGKNGVIATFKHYPGHGDTVVDSHIGTPSVEKSYDELLATELVPFKSAIENGADMIMTAHITYPALDEEVTFGDGKTKGYYPATMSKKMIEDILRGDLGYKGVVVTDALEMDAIRTAGLVPGAEDSVEYSVNIAKEVINAGCDILLLPIDMTDADKADFYDGYIKGIEDKVKAGEISEKRIDESVKRILMLKAEYGIYDVSGGKDKAADTDIEGKVAASVKTIGSASHHDTETGIAKEAITMLKNDDGLLPLSKGDSRIFLLERSKEDTATSGHAIEELKKEGYIDAAAQITSDYYYDASSDDKLHYTDEMKDKIAEADTVIAFSYAAGSGVLDKENPQLIALQEALADTHKAGGSFVLISENLPYDAAIYKDADAVILGYMGAGLGMDPTEKTDSGSGMPARNANVNAAIRTVFGAEKPLGHLPVNIPVVEEQADGSLAYGSSYLYERGFGLTY